MFNTLQFKIVLKEIDKINKVLLGEEVQIDEIYKELLILSSF
jgi:hypothetical protein